MKGLLARGSYRRGTKKKSKKDSKKKKRDKYEKWEEDASSKEEDIDQRDVEIFEVTGDVEEREGAPRHSDRDSPPTPKKTSHRRKDPRGGQEEKRRVRQMPAAKSKHSKKDMKEKKERLPRPTSGVLVAPRRRAVDKYQTITEIEHEDGPEDQPEILHRDEKAGKVERKPRVQFTDETLQEAIRQQLKRDQTDISEICSIDEPHLDGCVAQYDRLFFPFLEWGIDDETTVATASTVGHDPTVRREPISAKDWDDDSILQDPIQGIEKKKNSRQKHAEKIKKEEKSFDWGEFFAAF